VLLSRQSNVSQEQHAQRLANTNKLISSSVDQAFEFQQTRFHDACRSVCSTMAVRIAQDATSLDGSAHVSESPGSRSKKMAAAVTSLTTFGSNRLSVESLKGGRLHFVHAVCCILFGLRWFS
jgi:hypothetical protein